MAIKIDNDLFRKLLLSYPSKAIQFLYEAYYRSLLRIALNLTQDKDAAEDIVQEVFLYVWINSKRLGKHHEQSIEHYLVRAVRNKAITHYKKSVQLKVDRRKYIDNGSFAWYDNSVEKTVIEMEIIKEIRQLIATFPLKERECLLMKIDEELTTDQIALAQNVSRKAVERSLTSARKRLRKYWLSRKEAS